MDTWIQVVINFICAVFASSGLWALLEKRHNKHDVTQEMLLGLGHDRILELGLKYIERGDYITQDEYENLNDYLYKPYKRMNGNGSADRTMLEVNKLRIVKSNYTI